ncbi:MAG: hypothetical protein ABUS56_08150 [Acidobacteriota bacterium]
MRPLVPAWAIGLGGLALAVAMTLSPVTVALAPALVLVVVLGCRGLAGVERRVVFGVLVAAIALRVGLVGVLFLSSNPHHLVSFPFDGDGWYMKQRSIWIRNVWLGVPLDPVDFNRAFEAYGWTSYIYVLAYLQYLLGPGPYAVHLFNVGCFTGGAVMLARMVRSAYGPIAGAASLALTLFLPTLFMWSVSALKESLYFILLVAALVGLLQATRGTGRARRAAGAVLLFAAVLVLNTIRHGTMVIVVAALAFAMVGAFLVRRPYLLLVTALVVPLVAMRLAERPPIQARLLAQVRTSANLHIGNVHTEGHGYKLLDQRFYSGDPLGSMTWPEAQRFVGRAFVAFVLVPLPWQVTSLSEVLFIPQQMIWYVLVVLAAVGVVAGCRRDVFTTCLFVGMCAAGAAAIAPNEGNIGTMVRHRDGVVPFVVCLSAIGAVSLLTRAGVLLAVAAPRASDAQPSLFVPPVLLAAFVAFGRRAWASSRTAQALARLTHGSYLCTGIRALVRPTFGDTDAGSGVCLNPMAVAAAARVVVDSRLAAALRAARSALVDAWRHASIVSRVDGFRGLDSWQRAHIAGWVWLLGALLAAAAAPFGDQAWPSLFILVATVVAALALVAGSRRVAAAAAEDRSS